jgi:mycothiol synthase
VGRTLRVTEVDSATVTLLRELWSRAEVADGVAPVSEAFRLAVGSARPGVAHLLRYAGDGIPVGYAQVAGTDTPDAAAELVVDPPHRCQGHGRALLDAALAEGAVRVWAHGWLPAAQALAAAAALEPTRSLHRMRRPLTPADAADPALPPGFSVRPFRPGRDDETWVRLNAAAFARHPEQGSLTLADLHERMAQPWFDPAGLVLVEDDATGEVVAFHWTKVDPPPRRRLSDRGDTPPGRRVASDLTDDVGEVYVVGVDPAYQGRGLGGPLTRLGLAHLSRLGLAEVELYVDGDNEPALATYRRLGFEDAAIDVVYGLPERATALGPTEEPR